MKERRNKNMGIIFSDLTNAVVQHVRLFDVHQAQPSVTKILD